VTLADSLRALRQAANDVERAIDSNGALALPVGEIDNATLFDATKLLLGELHRRALLNAEAIDVERQRSDAERAAHHSFNDATRSARSLFYALTPSADTQR
jgi:hypothetical protein